LAETSISLDSLVKKQLLCSVFDKNDQVVIEEGTLISSADLVLLKSRDIPLENIEYTEPLKYTTRNALFNRLEGDLLLDFDYPSPQTIPGQPGQTITPELLKEIRKLKICPSYYLKRTFRGVPFDVVAPVNDPENYEVILEQGSKFTRGILKSLVRSGFHLFDFIPRIKSDETIISRYNNDRIVSRNTKIDKRHVSKMMFASIGTSSLPSSRNKKCKKTLISPDNALLAMKGEKITYAMKSKIKEHSLTACSPDIYSFLEGKTCPVTIVRMASKREELKAVHLLRLFNTKGFDISLLYRHLGYEELAHWFDPFLDIIRHYFLGGRVIHKFGSSFDPIDPLREYNGMIRLQLPEEIPDDREKENLSRSHKIRKMTGPETHEISKNAKQKIKQAGGRFIALMCVIESKRKVPAVFYHTTLQQDIPVVKSILNDISAKMELEAGMRIQEGKLF